MAEIGYFSIDSEIVNSLTLHSSGTESLTDLKNKCNDDENIEGEGWGGGWEEVDREEMWSEEEEGENLVDPAEMVDDERKRWR